MKVCLIGNNLTSLILANILTTKKFYVDIYFKKKPKYNSKSRTLGVTNYNFKYLLNFFKEIQKQSNPISQIKVLINNGKINEEILFKESQEPLFHMIKHESFLSFIKIRSELNKNIKFKNIKSDSNLMNKISEMKDEIIINCEASNILAKKFLKNRIFKNYNNIAYTTILNHNNINNNKAVQVFTKYGPIAFLPISNKTTSVVFSFEARKEYKINEKKILNLIKEHNPFYKITSNLKFEKFNLTLKLAKKYFYKNILFFGDSIHSVHPVAGQGFNMTIRDVIRFEKIIDKKIDLGLQIDKDIFHEFEKKSKSKNSIYSFGVDLIYEFFRVNKNFIPKNISQKFFSLVNGNQKIKKIGIELANRGLL